MRKLYLISINVQTLPNVFFNINSFDFHVVVKQNIKFKMPSEN